MGFESFPRPKSSPKEESLLDAEASIDSENLAPEEVIEPVTPPVELFKPTLLRPRVLWGIECGICGKEGHGRDECPEPRKAA